MTGRRRSSLAKAARSRRLPRASRHRFALPGSASVIRKLLDIIKNLRTHRLKLQIVLSILLIIILAGCSASSPKQLVRHNREHPSPTLSPILPPAITWKVITPNVTGGWNLGVARGKQEPYVYIGLSHRDYLMFTAWLNELVVYLKSQKAIQRSIEA
ncbi:hypothetical protein GAMM_200022 [Gammaproteobacteria bacterium]